MAKFKYILSVSVTIISVILLSRYLYHLKSILMFFTGFQYNILNKFVILEGGEKLTILT